MQLKAYEQAKSSAENAYSKAKALALQRLNSRNSQLLRSGASGNQKSTAPAGSAAAAPPTPEQADDRVPFTDDGESCLLAPVHEACLSLMGGPFRESCLHHLSAE